jgi:hypothetical protein
MENRAEQDPDVVREQEYIQRFVKAVDVVSHKLINENEYVEAEKKLAQILHENWQASYKTNPDNYDDKGQIKPRWRAAVDDEWIKLASDPDHPYHKHFRINPDTNAPEVDIYAFKNSDLPQNRRFENDAAAEFAVNEIRDAKMTPGDIMDEGFFIGAAREVHEEWKKRNPWAKNNEDVWQHFRDIPLVEQLKDMEHLVLAAELLAKIR